MGEILKTCGKRHFAAHVTEVGRREKKMLDSPWKIFPDPLFVRLSKNIQGVAR